MGEQRVSLLDDRRQMQKFVRHLLADVKALEHMLDNNMFDSGITRIGAEQEMVMVDSKTFKPVCLAMQVLEKMKDYDWVETELAQFNLETNMVPRELTGACFREMHEENSIKLNRIQESLDAFDAHLVLTGILPTMRKFHLDLNNLTPKKRYKALMEAMTRQLIGNAFELRLVGIDELLVKHESPLLEACNTSFQMHLQVDPDDFVKMYNISQVLAAPVMAIAANSPLVFGKRLWHESRIALFQQSLDTRTTHEHMRERSPRVSFGKDWLHESVLEIYKEDISRFRVLISSDVEEDSMQMLKDGKIPKLRALQVHNSTVYRWNRPCYGISSNGKPHLRIENRVLPAGPTVADEMANAVFWLGAMIGMADKVQDISTEMSFADARDNFGKAAKFSIDSKFTWFNDTKIPATKLIIEELLPLAEVGLQSRGVDQGDIDKYLGIIRDRAKAHMNGARWILRSYTHMLEKSSNDEALAAITSSIIKKQKSGNPVHLWEEAELSDMKDYRPSNLKVSEFMTTDLFTVQKDDVIELVAEMMNWRKIKHTPVEDSKGNLIGLINDDLLLNYYRNQTDKDAAVVGDIMITDPLTISEDKNIAEAYHLMKDNMLKCLPVVDGDELIGLITETDFLNVSGRMLDRLNEGHH